MNTTIRFANQRILVHLFALLLSYVSACFLSHAHGATFTEFSDFNNFEISAGDLVLETFDSAPWPGSQQGGLGGIMNLGLTWSSDGDLGSTGVVSVSGNTSIADFDKSPDNLDKIIATINISGVTAFGGHVHNFFDFSQADDITLTAFDSSNSVIATTVAPSPSNFQFIGVTTTADISRVEFTSSGPLPGDDFALDDVYFTFIIPEPSSIMLIIAGLTLFGIRRNRS